MDTHSMAISVAIGLGGEDRFVALPVDAHRSELMSLDDPELVITVERDGANFVISSPSGSYRIPTYLGPAGRLLAAAFADQLASGPLDHVE